MTAAHMLNRANLEPRLVTLISGLRVHQVEEAVSRLLDYIDAKNEPLHDDRLSRLAGIAATHGMTLQVWKAVCEEKKHWIVSVAKVTEQGQNGGIQRGGATLAEAAQGLLDFFERGGA